RHLVEHADLVVQPVGVVPGQAEGEAAGAQLPRALEDRREHDARGAVDRERRALVLGDEIGVEARLVGGLRELELVQAADQAGFHAYLVAEHQGTPLSIDGSPSVMLSAIFQRTRQLRAGGLTFCLPWYDPYRLYNEICMLDQMS